MMTNGPNGQEPRAAGQLGRIQRSRSDSLLGGVCGGIARHIGVDPVLVRIAVVLIALVSAGTAVLAYLVAWVLLPQAADEPSPRMSAQPAGGAKEAWTTVGGELKVLATELRAKPAPDGSPESEAVPGRSRRPSLQSVDAALTGFGDRLRAPEVQESARRTLAGLSAAVDASVEEIGSRVRRDRSDPGASPPSEPDRPGA